MPLLLLQDNNETGRDGVASRSLLEQLVELREKGAKRVETGRSRGGVVSCVGRRTETCGLRRERREKDKGLMLQPTDSPHENVHSVMTTAANCFIRP